MRWASAHSLYTSDIWAQLKANLLLERGDTCECGCNQKFKGTWDCIPHHIVELTDDNVNDAEIALNPANLLLVRHRCHNRIHGRFGGAGCRKVFLVWGSPGAGKSRFVAEAAGANDLILDLDSIWDCLCVQGRKGKPTGAKAEVFAIRDLLLDRIRMRSGRWRNAWVIGTYPMRGERHRVAATLGAELIELDTAQAICLDRVGDNQQRQQWVNDYWQKRQPDLDTPPTLEVSKRA